MVWFKIEALLSGLRAQQSLGSGRLVLTFRNIRIVLALFSRRSKPSPANPINPRIKKAEIIDTHGVFDPFARGLLDGTRSGFDCWKFGPKNSASTIPEFHRKATMTDPFEHLNQLCDELQTLSLEISSLEISSLETGRLKTGSPETKNSGKLQSLSSELSNLNRTIQARDLLYSAMTANFPSGALALFTPDLRYKLVEGSGIQMIGMSKETMLERSIHEVFSSETAALLEPDHRAAIEGHSSLRVIERHGRAISLHTVPVNINGQRYGLVVAQDVSQQKQNERELATQALTDALTGLGNRRAFEIDLAGEFSRADRHNYPLALLSLDLDGLKAINDTHGHHRGDEYLQAFASALRQHFRAGDRPYRLGGDEFIVLLAHAHPSGKRSILSHVRHAIQKVRNEFPGANVSAGVAFYPEDATDPAALLEMADQRMYRQKLEHHNTARGSNSRTAMVD
jgi:diguanylate cyclase (GGDEF)-like protein/PAS domain S-box-containing protein